MSYQSMGTTEDSRLIRGRDAVDVVDEGAVSFDEINGFNPSRRGRRGAALSLLVLAVGAVSALSAMRGRSSSQALDSTATNMVATADTPTIGVRAPFPKYSELSDEDVTSLFNNFKSKFDKTYVDEDEELMRMDIFRWNLKHIDMRNEGSQNVRHEVSFWTDLTEEEFKSYQTYGKVSEEAKNFAKSNSRDLNDLVSDGYCQACARFPELAKYVDGDLPDSFDWRDYGAVGHVKNQAYCGSCWSFSTTGCLEGAWYVAGHAFNEFSEQQLVVCDTEWNQGCNGGWPSLSMLYIKENGGIVPESIYPYRKVFMGDLPEPVCDPIVKADNYAATVGTDISISSETLDEDVMARMLILYGPLSVALDAEGMEYYGDGVDMGEYCEPLEIDHAVLIVGYGEEDGVKYWIIKNSWAVWWGERGYYRLVRGENACGIADEVMAIVV